ncbi:hypothetical protein MMC28_003339 [Mycoblastus sanguinarius]|nr:hypothetical protein [Mycoblastus sanguinarius]
MSQNFNHYNGTPHGSPPPRANSGYEGLMGSLISPGPATPLQQGFAHQSWPPHTAGWQNGNISYSMPYPGQAANQTAWNQNVQQDYVPFDDGDDELFTVDDTDMFPSAGEPNQNNGNSGVMQTTQNQQTIQSGIPHGQPPLPSQQAPPQPRIQNMATHTPPATTKSPLPNDSAARALELRAMLLAKKTESAASAKGSPASKSIELSTSKQNIAQLAPKQENGNTSSKLNTVTASRAETPQASAEKKAGNKPTSKTQIVPSENTVTNTDIEGLFAEARSAAHAQELKSALTNGNHADGTNTGKSTEDATNAVKQREPPIQGNHPSLKKVPSSSELSEGEIHSDAASPNMANQTENSTMEARQALQDTEEKLMRQSQVKKAYQPLKESKPSAPEPSDSAWAAPSPDDRQKPGAKASAKTLEDTMSKHVESPTSATTPRIQSWKTNSGLRGGMIDDRDRYLLQQDPRRDQDRERARDTGRRDDEREARRPSGPQQNSRQSDRDNTEFRRDIEARRKYSDDSAKAAAEYKKKLESKPVSTPKKAPENPKQSKVNQKQKVEAPSTQNTAINKTEEPATTITKKTRRISDAVSVRGEQDLDTVMLSPIGQAVEGDEDLNDWLELTNYYDLAHRTKRLDIFRGKRTLEAQRIELEREDQLVLQELLSSTRAASTRAASVLPTSSSPKVVRHASVVNVKMPPPPLPLKEPNNEVGMKIKDSALSAGPPPSQTSTPTLKRHHAEDDTDTKRQKTTEKLPRLDLNGHASQEKPLTSPVSVKSVKGEPTSAKGEQVSLESRISRHGDRWPAPRSRSPDYRRRSISPRRRQYSRSRSPDPRPGGKKSYMKCHNCSQLGHHVNQCTERRDGYRTCHNCGQQGHFANECTEPRGEGRDYFSAGMARTSSAGGNTRYQPYVSPNYRGRNPIARGRGNSPYPSGSTRSRYSSVGKTEDGEIGGGRERENVGSASLNLGAGGQSRR